ncbi:PhnD/SsuA/transferrin family substrate-binding protein [Oricola sp.]|uniref:PhnD/SsuA/transferrin family substrate-binding protein n=1 Tax=Oricola sp. TaxID=1979950 RepID=UPI003BAC6289
MSQVAALPMYDWPERRAATDARWQRLRDALRTEGFDAPDVLERPDDPFAVWTSPDLLIAETCTFPLATSLAGHVRYLATPVHQAPGCGPGTYRSAIVRRDAADMEPPANPGAWFETAAIAGRFAANMPESLSGHVALARDAAAAGLALPADNDVLWTGAHRASIRAVASGAADFAAIDCVSWALAQAHEPAAESLAVAGWTAVRPGLPLVVPLRFGEEEIARLRRAVLAAEVAVVLDAPLAI